MKCCKMYNNNNPTGEEKISLERVLPKVGLGSFILPTCSHLPTPTGYQALAWLLDHTSSQGQCLVGSCRDSPGSPIPLQASTTHTTHAHNIKQEDECDECDEMEVE